MIQASLEKNQTIILEGLCQQKLWEVQTKVWIPIFLKILKNDIERIMLWNANTEF